MKLLVGYNSTNARAASGKGKKSVLSYGAPFLLNNVNNGQNTTDT